MARRRRRTEVFSMSFLDCMSCGFGAVILFFMIINATVKEQSDIENQEELSEVRRIEREVLEGRKNLVQLRNTLEETNDEIVRAEGDTERLIERIRELEERLAEYDDTTVAREESEEQLRADIEQLEEARRRLAAAVDSSGPAGEAVRAFVGDGSRQYLSGLRVGGERTLILVDSSSSMLDQSVVNIIRRRIQPPEQQLRSAKWRQAVASVDWITTQLPRQGKFQVYRFNEKAEPAIAGSAGLWLDVGDGDQLERAVQVLRTTPPSGGTNLWAAFRVASEMSPRPDNILLLVDSLPTVGERPPAKNTVSPGDRLRLFGQAVRELPSGIPVNILMYPMEGDYMAPVEYWKLAYRSRGSFMSISDDWP
ncbi:MAG: VWA domain-containing protein [Pseudomonadota bacterium]